MSHARALALGLLLLTTACGGDDPSREGATSLVRASDGSPIITPAFAEAFHAIHRGHDPASGRESGPSAGDASDRIRKACAERGITVEDYMEVQALVNTRVEEGQRYATQREELPATGAQQAHDMAYRIARRLVPFLRPLDEIIADTLPKTFERASDGSPILAADLADRWYACHQKVDPLMERLMAAESGANDEDDPAALGAEIRKVTGDHGISFNAYFAIYRLVMKVTREGKDYAATRSGLPDTGARQAHDMAYALARRLDPQLPALPAPAAD